MILSISQEGVFGAQNVNGKVFIVDTSLRKYKPKILNQWATEIK